MEEELRTLLINSSSIAAIVSGRIDWGSRTQGAAYPGISLNLISNASFSTMQGPDGLLQGRVQIDCYALTYKEAKQLARLILALLDGYRGGNFSGIFLETERDYREGGTNEADRPFRVSLDFLTNWRSS